MKRLFAAIAATCFAAGIAVAQDYNAAIDAFNAGAQAESKTEALEQFRSALAQFEVCEEEEAAEMVTRCKEAITNTLFSIAKEQINNALYDEALVSLGETVETARSYGLADVAADATDLVPNVYLRKGTSLLKSKEFAPAAEALREVVALKPEDGQTWILLGQALMNSGDTDGSVEAFTQAAANGKEEQANKLLSTIFLKKGQAFIKAGKNNEAIEALTKANEYLPTGPAYKLIASACTKLGKSAAAIDAYKQYLELTPDAKDASDVLFTIAAVAQKNGDKATAIEYYKKLSGDAKYAAQAAQQLSQLQK